MFGNNTRYTGALSIGGGGFFQFGPNFDLDGTIDCNGGFGAVDYTNVPTINVISGGFVNCPDSPI